MEKPRVEQTGVRKEEFGVDMARRFFSGTGSSYDLIANLCTVGMDLLWKAKILEKIPSKCRHIIDQACGTGILTFKIARRFPYCRVTGVELRDEYLNVARERAKTMRLRNVEFILGRAENVRLEDPVDCITSSYLAKYAELGSLIRNAKAMLRHDGLLVMHDFTYPPGFKFSRLWEMYFKILQSIGARLFPEWRTVFCELPGFLRQTRWVAELLEKLEANGFTLRSIESLTLGTCAIVAATA
jgi:demethylmenaquinone methyltransferase/2-methoxy-6-polyprenyl-1,4-benzoquinol methylase